MKHTPTPWKVSERDWYVVSNRGHICEMMGPFGYDVNKANARRIVACVNACEGIETSWLEKHKLQFTGHAIDEIQKLRAENARILAALKEIEKGEGPYKIEPLAHAEATIENMKKIARAALYDRTQLATTDPSIFMKDQTRIK